MEQRPEPATYQPSDIDSHNQSYLLSKYRTNGTKKFVQLSRKPDPKQPLSFCSRQGKSLLSHTLADTPGPGSYVAPSDFGIVVSPRAVTQGGARP